MRWFQPAVFNNCSHQGSQWVTQIAGQARVPPPCVDASVCAPVNALVDMLSAALLDSLLATANAAAPFETVGYIVFSADGKKATRVRKRQGGDPHLNGLSAV